MVQAKDRSLGTSAFGWYLKPGEKMRSERQCYVDAVQRRPKVENLMYFDI